MKTLGDMILDRVTDKDSICFYLPNQGEITYAELGQYIAGIIDKLQQNNIISSALVAIVMPDRGLFAMSIIATSVFCTAMPLNPDFTETEYKHMLADIEVDALLIMEGETECAAASIARSKSIPIIQISQSYFNLKGDYSLTPYQKNPEAQTLLLSTSGTTGKPKHIAFTHSHILSSIKNIAESHSLTKNDICLNSLPLFHAYGLTVGLWVVLYSNGSVILTPKFNSIQFLESYHQ